MFIINAIITIIIIIIVIITIITIIITIIIILQPWVDYVPFKRDASDIDQVLACATHDV